MTAPLVSVLLPTADRPDWARMAARLIEAQTYRPLELVVVNAGKPIEGLPSFAREVRATAKGFPEQNGQTLLECSGEIMVFIDDDDYYAPDRIARQVEPILAGRATVTGVKMYYYVEVPAMRWYHRVSPVPRDPGVPKGWPAPFFEGSACFHRSVLRHFKKHEIKRIWRTPFCMKLHDVREKIEVIPNKNAVVRVQHVEGSSGAPQCFKRDFKNPSWTPCKQPPEIPAYVIEFWKAGGKAEVR